MTSTEMLREFKVGMDKIDSDSYPEIYPEQIYMFINKAIDILVNTGRKVFEADQTITDNLKSLIPDEPVKIVSTKVDDTYKFDLKSIGYLFYISSSIYAKVGDKIKRSSVKVTQHDDLQSVLDDPFNYPKPHRIPITFSRNTIKAYSDGSFEIPYILLTYVKKPAKVSATVDCDIDEQLHYTIVDSAITLAMDSLGIKNNTQ